MIYFVKRPYHIGGFWFKAYDAILPFVSILVHIVGIFHHRLGTALRGRKGGVKVWRFGQFDEKPLILIHTASRGEFEGVLPLIERLHQAGVCRIAVSYSSPSVVNLVAETPGVWACGYLPLDFFERQLRFLARLEPNLILISKHDFWPNTLRAAATLNIPVILINANFHSASRRSLPIIKHFSQYYMKFLTAIWTVSDEDTQRAARYVKSGVELLTLGDTRYDQTLKRAKQGVQRFANLKVALGTGPIFVAGSTWSPEERMVWQVFSEIQREFKNAKLVIAPHELTEESFARIKSAAHEYNLTLKSYSSWNGETINESALFIDKMGVLAQIYSVGFAALVGGGFGKGVHSVLEPAANGLPVVFGPRYQNSHEAGLLIKAQGGFVISNSDDLRILWNRWLKDESSYRNASSRALEVVISKSGTTEKLYQKILSYIIKDGIA